MTHTPSGLIADLLCSLSNRVCADDPFGGLDAAKSFLFPDAKSGEDKIQDVVTSGLTRERVKMTQRSV
jgi:hypothetical protein